MKTLPYLPISWENILHRSWLAYLRRRRKNEPYEVEAFVEVARGIVDDYLERRLDIWLDLIAEWFGTGYCRLEGEGAELKLVQYRPYRGHAPRVTAEYETEGGVATDCRGAPLTMYCPKLCRRLQELLVAAGEYPSLQAARAMMQLADRYCERGQWVASGLQRLLYDDPKPCSEQDIRAYFESVQYRPPAAQETPVQQSLF